MLRNHSTGSYYGIILGNDIMHACMHACMLEMHKPNCFFRGFPSVVLQGPQSPNDKATIAKARFAIAKVARAKFAKAKLAGAKFAKAKCAKANFAKAKIAQA